MQITRLFDIIHNQLENHPLDSSMAKKVGGEWQRMSSEEVVASVNMMSKGLMALGVGPQDKVAIISANRPEWTISELAILQLGAVAVPVYPTITEDEYAYVLNHSGAKVVFISQPDLLEKLNNVKGQLSALEQVFTFEEIEGEKHWTEVHEAGVAADNQSLQALKDRVKGEDLATILYTSGTTGVPKGVMLSHNNILSNVLSCTKRIPVEYKSVSASFLPLSHIYERTIMYLYLNVGISVHYSESLDDLGAFIKEVQPDVFTAVPRLIEKVFDKIMAKGEELSGMKRKLFYWAVELAEQYEPYGVNGGWYEFKLKIARKLIFSKWQEALGGNVKAIASGSAALQPRLARIFNAAELPLFEGYGLTETSPVVSVNDMRNGGLKFGTVGRPIENVDVKIADDGEILVKGPNVMMGYYNAPDLTAEVMKDGWFCTGDIGEFVGDNFLKITDRKKEIFKTSGGKYVAPQVMENKFKESRFIEQIMVIGENRKHPAALIVPSFDFLKDYCVRKGIPYNGPQEVIKNEVIVKRIGKAVSLLNEEFGNWERVKKFELLPAEWSIEGGELTPTLKLRRKPILKKYNALVEKIYAE